MKKSLKSILLSISVILVLGCNKNANPTIEPIIERGLLENQLINVSGTDRTYHLYIPQNPTNAPIVMLFHGNGSNFDEILGLGTIRDIKAPYKVWLTIAEQENIVLVIPDGTDNGWNDCRNDAAGNPSTDDVLFTNNLIDFILNKYQANASKIFAVGTSNGGHMTMRLAQEIPNKLKAFAAIVTANPKNSQCTNSTVPISALFMIGTEDPILPDEGGPIAGQRGEVFSALETIDYWVNRNQTDLSPIETEFANTNTTDDCTVTKYLYANGSNNTEVAFYLVNNGGHNEPSIAERYGSLFLAVVGNQNGDIEMASEVWNFFKTK